VRPSIAIVGRKRRQFSEKDDALRRAADAIRSGKIVALKGIGGFQLIVDARNRAAVVRLRERKHREEKPFALMYPSLDAVRADCEVSELEERSLLSPESPIVLVKRDHWAGQATAQRAVSTNWLKLSRREIRTLAVCCRIHPCIICSWAN
jgi:Hydrogenase maturation factor